MYQPTAFSVPVKKKPVPWIIRSPLLTTNKVFLDHTLQAFVAPDRPQSLLRHPQFSAADAAAAPAQLAALVA
jgi:hypothetical protein